jgi:hypothetical protein
VVHSLVSPGARLTPIRLQSCLFRYPARAVAEISSHAINLFGIYLPVPICVGLRFATSACHSNNKTGPTLPFPPHFLGTYYPLFRVISITMSPSRQPYHTCATSSSQPPWRSFPSDLTDMPLSKTLVHFYCVCTAWNSTLSLCRAWPLLDVYRQSL